ncbi:MAG: GxxExxY protein [Planctomycetota bacterium]
MAILTGSRHCAQPQLDRWPTAKLEECFQPPSSQRAPRISDELTEKVIGAAIEVHRFLGPGLLESIYEDALCFEMEMRQVPHQRQVCVDVIYKEHRIKGQKIDILVANEVVVELKAVTRLPDIATAQTLSYLRSTGLKRALLLNFGEKRLVDGLKRLSL